MNSPPTQPHETLTQLVNKLLGHSDNPQRDELAQWIAELCQNQAELARRDEQLRDAQAALERLQLDHARLLNSAPLGYAILDERGCVIDANQALSELLNRDRSELIERPLAHFVHANDRSVLEIYLESLGRRQAHDPVVVRLCDAQQSSTDMDCYTRIQGLRTPVNGADAAGAHLFFSDISRLRRYEKELDMYRHEQASLVEARQQAEAANRAKSDFLSHMSHEIRTPMNAILGLAHLVLKQPLDDKTRDQMQKLHWSANSLLGILNNILDFSKIEADKLEIERSSFDPAELIDNVLRLFKPAAADSGVLLTARIMPALPERLIGDSLRLTQVLTNLVSNAIKFSSSGSEVVVGLRALEPLPDERYEFSVQDSGIGISQTHQEKLFQPFHQGPPSTTRQYGGTGLGLAISRQLVELMGGHLGVTSAPGRGSLFHFTLRMQRSSDKPSTPTGCEPVVSSTLQGHHILLVEDDDINRELACELLIDFGLSVTPVRDGQQALQQARRQRFDGILMDLQMPVMDGFETTRAIRALNDEYSRVPIIALTANAMKEGRDQAMRSGMDDYILKPFDPDALQATLTRWLRPKSH
jgi:signal transduction histidine kinase/ActR/RegA family two-component response regulator